MKQSISYRLSSRSLPVSIFALAVVLNFADSRASGAETNSVAAPAVIAQSAAGPPASAPQRSATELEKLAAPIALHPDPLIAIILPASVYPVEVVQAARFVKNTNNLARLDQQPWDDKVKQVAKFPQIIAMMDADIGWTAELGKAFVDQPMDLMNAIQALRAKAQAAGKLKTTSQQIVMTTNAVVERTYQNQVVYVTNTVIQVQPASSEVVYVPSYNPSVVYVDDDDDEAAAAFISFGVGMAFGAAVWGDCDWHYGGCYWGHYPPPPPPYPPPYYPPPGARPPPPAGRPPGSQPPGNRPPGSQPPGNRPPGNQPPGARPPTAATQPAQRWQPDQARLSSPGGAGVATREARGWAGASAQPAQRPVSSNAGTRPAQQPAVGNQPVRTGGVGQPSVAPATRTTSNWQQPAGARTGQTPAASSRPAPSSSVNRPSAQPSSAFSGMSSGGNARSFSSRGAASRGGGGGARGGGGRGR